MTEFAVYPFSDEFLTIGCENGAVVSIDLSRSAHDKGSRSALSDMAYIQLSEYLKGERKGFDFPFELRGTDFQKRVWTALCEIPYGQTRSYKQIAEAIGSPKVCRAVGMANHRNPIMIVVPCHRVIGANGALVGYGAGLPLKERLLRLERENSR